jgi:6-phosphogluconolactonase
MATPLTKAVHRITQSYDARSNYRLADDTLISRVPLPRENLHRVYGELEPETAARLYEQSLRDFFGPQPRFDLVLLGLGQDGHIASLFPGAAALDEKERLAVAVEAHYRDRPACRVTLTLPPINGAMQVWVLVSGTAKAEIVRAALEGDDNRLPARRICPTAGRLTWLMDMEAAARLHTGS